MAKIDRREFLQLVGTSAGAAAASGCSDHVEKLIPYVVQPEEITPGIPVYYASTCKECPAGCGIRVKTREGRPILVEGNPDHPVNRGALCARGQASIGRTYRPDRYKSPMIRNEEGDLVAVTWEVALERLTQEISDNTGSIHILGSDPGETLGNLLDRFAEQVGGSRTVVETFGNEALREATRLLYGTPSEPIFDLSGADLIVDFGSECLDTGLSPTEHQRQLSDARNIKSHPDGGARFVYIGGRMSMTGSNADEWIPARPGSEGILALALAQVSMSNGLGNDKQKELFAGLLSDDTVAEASRQADVPIETIERLGRALAASKRAVVLPPGPAVRSRRAIGSTAAVLLLNDIAGSVGSAVKISGKKFDKGSIRSSYRELLALIKQMQDGKVGVLLIQGLDPVYALPDAAGFSHGLERVKFIVSFASSPDETSAHVDLVLPDHTPLESWGDLRPRDGIRSLVQPSLRPLYDTRSVGDAIMDVSRSLGGEVASAMPDGSFRDYLEEAWSDTDLHQAKSKGGVFDSGKASVSSLSEGVSRIDVSEPKFSGEGEYTLLAFPHSFLYDGRGAGLPWLQEIPDPVTSVAWQTWAEISTATAERLGVQIGDIVAIETSAGRIEVPVYPRGGIRDDVVAVPIGQGHSRGFFASKECDGMPGVVRGVNVMDALSAGVDEEGGRAWLTEKASIVSTGRSRRLPMLQFSDNKRERQLGEVVSLAALAGDESHSSHSEHDGHHEIREPFDASNDAAEESLYRWGMSVDLDRCTGCSACIQACYVENNIPLVGELETLRVRQMAWIRVDRFVGEGKQDLTLGREHPTASSERLGETDVRNSPMFCQQCGAAPCEPVCPVIATYTNEEGLNAMVYNRCIGTRYCANNCPYKVRRYNYFDNQLTKWPEPMHLMLNPDVTVRGQGVMEKCTFCIQRIQEARQNAKDEGRPIRDGEVRTACQTACPSQAINFGNLKDPSAVVSQIGNDQRSYHALHVLNTRPAVNYLAKVVRGKVGA